MSKVMFRIAGTLANQLTRTRKTIGPQDIKHFLPQIWLTTAENTFRARYPEDPQRKTKEIVRYALISNFVKGARVLDIGSGSFYGAAMLAENAQAVVGTELNRLAVLQARVTWRKSNLTCLCKGDLSYLKGKYDVASVINVIEHMSEHDALWLLKDTGIYLTPKGKLILCTPRKRKAEMENPDHIKEYNETELEQLVRQAGFTPSEKYVQTMTEIKPGGEVAVNPNERAWFLWILEKAEI